MVYQFGAILIVLLSKESCTCYNFLKSRWSDVRILNLLLGKEMPDLLLGSVSPDVTTLKPDLVNCRISCLPSFRGAAGAHF